LTYNLGLVSGLGSSLGFSSLEFVQCPVTLPSSTSAPSLSWEGVVGVVVVGDSRKYVDDGGGECMYHNDNDNNDWCCILFAQRLAILTKRNSLRWVLRHAGVLLLIVMDRGRWW
jgi:hypothetical protein